MTSRMKGLVAPTVVFCLLLTLAESLSRHDRQVELDTSIVNGPGCECVPFYECDIGAVEGSSTSALNELVNIRIDGGDSLKCDSFIAVCCNARVTPPSRPVPGEGNYVPKCGRRNFHGISVRILGEGFPNGEAQFGEFPWMAAVLKEEGSGSGNSKKTYVSGAALIRPNVVLTTAHHVYTYTATNTRLLVRLGEWDSQITTEFHKHEDIPVSKIIVHEDYNNANLVNDYALLILERPVVLSPHIDTICLPTGRGIYDTNKCLATGWGKDAFENHGKFQNILKLVELPLIDRTTCQQQLRNTRLGQNYLIHDSFTCAGGKEGRDTCRGDGGSPLVCPLLDDPETYEVVGLVAWGIGCGTAGVPGVYANINYEKIIGWILTTMDPYEIKG